MNYVDLVFSIILILASLVMGYLCLKETDGKLVLCFALVFNVSIDYSLDEFIEAYNKINPPCELAQGCVKKEVSI